MHRTTTKIINVKIHVYVTIIKEKKSNSIHAILNYQLPTKGTPQKGKINYATKLLFHPSSDDDFGI